MFLFLIGTIKRFLFKDQTLSMYDVRWGGGGEGGREGLKVIWECFSRGKKGGYAVADRT